MSAGALAAPHLLAARCVPVLVGGLRELRPHLHQVLRVGLHQRLGGEQTQVCATHISNPQDSKDQVSSKSCQRVYVVTVFVSTLTQFERSCQAPDDGDGIGGVCAELMQRWEEGVPLVLQLWDGGGDGFDDGMKV